MIEGMARRMSSERIIGRTAELGTVSRLVDELGSSVDLPLLIIGGEAGVGKSRLVSHLVELAASRDCVVLTGACIEHGAQVSPLNAVRQLLEVAKSRGLAGAVDVDALLAASADAIEPARLFQLMKRIVTEAARRQGVVVVVEDLHWADESTAGFLQALLSGLYPHSSILVVATLRTDELHRRHLLMPFLASIERQFLTERVELTPLTQEETTELAVDITNEAITSSESELLYSQSGGNPFFVEELLMGGRGGGSVPESLRQIILSRCHSLDQDATVTLNAAAILSSPFDDQTLQATSGLSRERYENALDSLAKERLLVDTGRGHGFRHELVREVIAGELLPGERSRLHRQAAEALCAHQPHRLGELAHHRFLSGDQPEALRALVAAGEDALAIGAAAEAADHFGRALGLWDRVSDAVDRAGMSQAGLLRASAGASALARRFDAAVELGRQAAIALEDEDPAAAGLAWYELSEYLWNATSPGVEDAIARARRLIPSQPASVASARIDRRRAFLANVKSERSQAADLAEHALNQAREVDAHGVAANALSMLAVLHAERGNDSHIDELVLSLEAAQKVDGFIDLAPAVANLVQCLLVVGRYHEIPGLFDRWITPIVDEGLGGVAGMVLQVNALEAYFHLGRWDDAAQLVASMHATHGRESVAQWSGGMSFGWGNILVARGQFEQAAALFTPGLHQQRAAYYDSDWGVLMAGAIALGAHGAISEPYNDEVEEAVDRALPSYPIGAAMAVAYAGRYRVNRYSDSSSIETVRRWIARIESVVTQTWDVRPAAFDAWLHMAKAELATATGDVPDPCWADIARSWSELGLPHPEAYARYRLSEQILGSTVGGPAAARERATVELRASQRIAERLGARPLVDDIGDLARRARLDLSTAPEPKTSPAPFGLTKREVEVLRLVSQGKTNSDIGRELFISHKTASVHVSNILRKLQVRTRIEAGAVAREQAITGDT